MDDDQGLLFDLPPPVARYLREDPIWEALTDYFGEPLSKGARGRRNEAVKQLREAKAAIEDIELTIDWCEMRFGHFTEMAICMYLGRAIHDRNQREAERKQREALKEENVIELAARRKAEERGE